MLRACDGREPSQHESKPVAGCSEAAEGGGIKESLVAEEQIVDGAEDEKCADTLGWFWGSFDRACAPPFEPFLKMLSFVC